MGAVSCLSVVLNIHYFLFQFFSAAFLVCLFACIHLFCTHDALLQCALACRAADPVRPEKSRISRITCSFISLEKIITSIDLVLHVTFVCLFACFIY